MNSTVLSRFAENQKTLSRSRQLVELGNNRQNNNLTTQSFLGSGGARDDSVEDLRTLGKGRGSADDRLDTSSGGIRIHDLDQKLISPMNITSSDINHLAAKTTTHHKGGHSLN